MTISRINFTSIPAADQDRAIAFYTGHLGFEVTLDAPYEEGWRWIFLSLPGAETRLHLAKSSELSWIEGMPALTLVSDDVDAEAERLKAAGVEITMGPDTAPWAPQVRFLMIRDSEANIVLLESVKGA
ncbi:glyoxalase [Rhodobacterales bacterium HKCCE3408]|nr:glyoxalase [Rhodobacterales bacterium HKCCE3408]